MLIDVFKNKYKLLVIEQIILLGKRAQRIY